jgi:hypothetical protein
MKKLITIIFVVAMAQVQAQSTAVTYTEVVQVDEASKKEQLYKRALNWFNSAFKDSKEVIQNQDKEAGEVTGKGSFEYTSKVFLGSSGTKGYVNFIVKITAKDGRYKYEFTEYRHDGLTIDFGLLTTDEECPYKELTKYGPKSWVNSVWVDLKAKSDAVSKPLIESLKTAMSKKLDSESDNW